MELGRFTDPQRESILYEGSHLFIEAGAGTGKTATLTAKIVHMMGTQNDLAFGAIADLLAITFTDLAAGELKGRIRSMLRQEGLVDEALLVDDAWVSTIHGMCARILRDNAFALGVDPDFSITVGPEADELLTQATHTIIDGGASPGIADDLADLFGEYPIGTGTGRFEAQNSILHMVRTLGEKLSTIPGGSARAYLGPEPRGVIWVAQEARDVLADIETWATTALPKPSPATLRHLMEQAGTAELLTQLIDEAVSAADPDDRAFVERLADIMSRKPRKITQGRKLDSYPDYAESHDRFAWLAAETAALVSWPQLQQFVRVADEVRATYDALKREVGVLDNNDLLAFVSEAFQADPHLAERYAEQFKLIMIDEFQDTDAMQTTIAQALSKPGENSLITVGDAQQSIYRFRGADVNLFRRYSAELPQDAGDFQLDTNFRSHADILAFVNSVFSADEVFGERYLALGAGRKERFDAPAFTDAHPRVSIQMTASEAGINAHERRRHAAARIAESFQAYRAAGWKPSDMVVLLGKMTHSNTYAEALTAAGFETIITGGSVFWNRPEPQFVGYILRVLSNPLDDEALYHVLESPFFSLTADEFALLVIERETSGPALWYALRSAGEKPGAPARITHAREIIERALRDRSTRAPSVVLRRFAAESGVITRNAARSVAGTTSTADLLKAINTVEQLQESHAPTFAEVARAYTVLMDTPPSERPGTLMVSGQEAVRIMTIHSSKGLEFPIVALAEFTDNPTSKSAGMVEVMEGIPFLALQPKEFLSERNLKLPKIEKTDGNPLTPASLVRPNLTNAEYHAHLVSLANQEELEENRRLFYVGATRAEEALVISLTIAASGVGSTPSMIHNDISRLFPEGTFPQEDSRANTGGTSEAHFKYEFLEADESGVIQRASDPAYILPTLPPTAPSGGIPRLGEVVHLGWTAARPFDDAYEFSYSSLARTPELSPASSSTSDISLDLTSTEVATELGSAFHLIAEYMIRSGLLSRGSVVLPSGEKIAALSAPFDLTSRQEERLMRALDTWSTSDIAVRVSSHPIIRAEVPFYLEFGSGSTYLHGEIDVLCLDETRTSALIIDYKTGGRKDETPEELHEKHLLQALCYAEATLAAGVDSVELVFVRMEHVDDSGQPQTVGYSFDSDDRTLICERLEHEFHTFASGF